MTMLVPELFLTTLQLNSFTLASAGLMLDCSAPCGTADVECPHGQLGAGLTDGLRGNHANSLTLINLRTTSKITAVAGCADPAFGVTRQNRANPDGPNLSHSEFFNSFFI